MLAIILSSVALLIAVVALYTLRHAQLAVDESKHAAEMAKLRAAQARVAMQQMSSEIIALRSMQKQLHSSGMHLERRVDAIDPAKRLGKVQP